MNNESFKQLISNISHELTGDQLVELEAAIKRTASTNAVSVLFAKRTAKLNETRICPHCQGSDVVKNGSDSRDRQRFRCRNQACRKSFNILTKTALSRARKPEQWMTYLGFMSDHCSLPSIKKSGQVKVTYQTMFRWRHRFLSAVNGNTNVQLSGIVEADETFFPFSLKGCRDIRKAAGRRARVRSGVRKRGLSGEQVPVVTALDNTGIIVQSVLEDRNEVDVALAGRIAAGSLLCSDGFSAYRRLAASAGVEHRIIEPRRGFSDNPIRKGGIGLGRVNAYHGQAKALINIRCRGVATKYLGNYMNWQRSMTQDAPATGFLEKSLL